MRPAQTTGDLFINEALFVINGNGRRQTTYELDNTDADDSWGRQTMFAAVPFSVVQEFTVTRIHFGRIGTQRRHRGRPGNQVWSNDWHGDFVGMGRPHSPMPSAARRRPGREHPGAGQREIPDPSSRTRHYSWFLEYTNQNRDADDYFSG